MRLEEIFAPKALELLAALARSLPMPDDVQELGIEEVLQAIDGALDGRLMGFVILGVAAYLVQRLDDMDEAIREHLVAANRDVEFFRHVGLLD